MPTVRALADEDVLVVVTNGSGRSGRARPTVRRRLPANVRVTRFIPYDLALSHARAFVTNGGYTGVTLALAQRRSVGAGRHHRGEGRDRCAGSGIPASVSPLARPVRRRGAIADGVRRVLTEPGFAAAASRIRDEMAGHDAGREGADLLERLALTGRPVLRAESGVAAGAGR